MSTQIPSYVWERCQNIRKRSRDGKINFKNFNRPIVMQNYLKLTESRLSSSGIFSQGIPHWKCSRKSRKICKAEVLNQKDSEIESSACLCSTTSMDQEGNSEKCISDSEEIKNYAERFPQGHWTFLGPGDEKKWYGTLSYKPDGKWDSAASSMVQRFAETCHQIFKGISALSRGILKRKQNGDTIHFNADSSRTQNSYFESFTQQISSVCTEQCLTGVKRTRSKTERNVDFKFETTEQTLKEVRPREVNSLVQTSRDDRQASGNRLRDTFRRFGKLDTETKFARVCGAAAFWELVSVGMRYKTVPDVDDDFGGRTPACREYTHPREQANSRVYAAIPGNTIIGPVLQVHMVKFLVNYRVEIQIPSTATQDRTFWVIMCRGKNRYVENVSLQDPGRIREF